MYRLKSSEDISPRGEIAASWDLEFPLDSVEVLNFCMVSFYGLPPAKIDVPKGVNKVLHIGADTYLVFDNEQAPKRVADSVKHWRNSLAVKN